MKIKILIILAALCIASSGYAAQKTITVGTSGSKASLDTNFGNAQDNFTELYGFLGSGTDGTYGISLNNNTSTFAPQSGYTGGFSIIANQPYAYISSANVRLQAWDTDLDSWAAIAPATGNIATTGTVQAKAAEVDGAAAITLSAAQVSGTIITNYGQADEDVELTLPTAAAGYNALFTVGTARAHKWAIKAGTNDKIYLIAAAGTVVAGSDNGAVKFTAAQVGQAAACWTFKTGSSAWDWQCKAGSVGTSTFVAE